MNAAGAYGRGRWVQAQLFYSTYSLQVHDRAPGQINFDDLLRQDSERFSHFSFVDGNRMYASFTHLTGYSSNYYTYVLDKVIAVDFFSQFNAKDPIDDPTAMRYRQAVIDKGGTAPAADLVKAFLGRPQSVQALKNWIEVEFRK
jgi:thimet oligopeptidase